MSVDSTKPPSPPQRTSSFRLGDLYFAPRFTRPTQKDARELFAEIKALGPTTSAGLPITFRWDDGILRVSVDCTKQEWDALAAQRAARQNADSLRAAAVSAARAALRDARTRDYSDASVKRSLGLTVMPKKGTA
jgi:hypothetical protein